MALARKHDMNFWRLLAPMAHGWAIAAAGGTEAGWDEVRRAVADCREQGIHGPLRHRMMCNLPR